jgi:hypothetical protein
MSINCTSGNYRDKTSHNKQIYTLKKNLLKFENEFIDIENHEFEFTGACANEITPNG